MFEDDVETLRHYYAAGNRQAIEDAAQSLAPDFEFYPAGVFPDIDRVYRGREAFAEFLEQFAEPWEELGVEPQKFIDADGRILVVLRFHAKGRDGIEVKLTFYHLWTIQDGKASRLDAYSDEADALAACGLPGSALS